MRRYYVYILASVTHTLYTGVTNKLSVRAQQHCEKSTPGFTQRYNVTQLVYYEVHDSIRTAVQREKQIKGWLRAKKIALIEKHNPEWKELDPP